MRNEKLMNALVVMEEIVSSEMGANNERVLSFDMNGYPLLKIESEKYLVDIDDVVGEDNKKYFIRAYLKDVNVKDNLFSALRVSNFYNETRNFKVFIRECIEDDMMPVIEIKVSLKKILKGGMFKELKEEIGVYREMLEDAFKGKSIEELMEKYI